MKPHRLDCILNGTALVFISYAREDASEARRLYRALRDHGIDCWLDSEALLPGERWKPAIRQAIRRSDYFIALLSRHSVGKRGFVQAELAEALRVLEEHPADTVYLIPVRLDDCEVSHETLSELNWVNLFEDFESALTRVVQAIELGEKSELAVRNRTVGGRLRTAKEWDEADFVDSLWHQRIDGGNPSEVYIQFRPAGEFLFAYNRGDGLKPTESQSTWYIDHSLLVLDWNSGYNRDTFPLPEVESDTLHGTQSVGNKAIVFERVRAGRDGRS